MCIKGKKLNVFVRFGGLDLKTQEGYSKNSTSFHTPPSTRGFYAMPKITQEFFLIGSLSLTQPYNFPKPHNDISGEKSNMVYTLIRKEFVVKNDSNLWHHLNVKNCDVLERNGSWVKTSLKVWEKAISKESIKLRIESSHHFEVFFDEKI